MSFSAVTSRGSIAERVLDTTIVLNPDANIAVGKIAFAYGVTDNITITQGDSTDHSIADTDGNSWAKLFEYTQTLGVANDGVTASFFWTKVATQIDTTDAITLTMVSSAVAKVLMCFECTITGTTIQLANDGVPLAHHVGANVVTPTATVTSGMTSQEYLHIGLVARQDETSAWTADSDYTDVFTPPGTNSGPTGTAATNVSAYLASRIATLTGDTFSPTFVAGRMTVATLLALEEVFPAGGTTWPGYQSPFGWS